MIAAFTRHPVALTARSSRESFYAVLFPMFRDGSGAFARAITCSLWPEYSAPDKSMRTGARRLFKARSACDRQPVTGACRIDDRYIREYISNTFPLLF
jgi:hypothetical protein